MDLSKQQTHENDVKRRVEYLDFARGLAIFFMITQHAVILYAHHMGEEDLLGGFFLLCGTAPAAPVFMLLMGVFFAHSKKSNPAAGVGRGVRILGAGYLLNFLRFTLPLLVAGKAVEQFEGAGPWQLLGSVDILQMAGLSLMIMALLKRFVPKPGVWFVLAIAVMFVSPFLWGRGDFLPVMNLLWGTDKLVFFPLFPWLFYPLLGMALSDLFFDADEHQYFNKRCWIVGLVLIGIGFAVMLIPALRPIARGDYFRSGFGDHLLVVGVVFCWLAICKVVTKRLETGRIFNVLKFWSRNITVIYFIQWILFGWGLLVLKENGYPSGIALLIGLGVMLLTDRITRGIFLCKQKQL